MPKEPKEADAAGHVTEILSTILRHPKQLCSGAQLYIDTLQVHTQLLFMLNPAASFHVCCNTQIPDTWKTNEPVECTVQALSVVMLW